MSSVGKICGKFTQLGTNWTFSAASYTDYNGSYLAPVTATYSWKVKSGKKTVTKKVTRNLTLSIAQGEWVTGETYLGVATLTDVEGNKLEATQNLWDSAYKTAGKNLFTTKSGKKTLAYRTFSRTADVDGKICPLSIKVTSAGVLTATLTYDTGKKSKGKTVYYKPTCSTVVWPTSTPDDDALEAAVILYIAPSAANNLPYGFSSYESFAK